MHFMPRVVYKGFAHSTQQQIRKVFGLRRAVPKANTTKVREEEYQKIILWGLINQHLDQTQASIYKSKWISYGD